jgi:tetratricopeptide (TPR) repeat protein
MRHKKTWKAWLLVPVLVGAGACADLALDPQASISNDAYFQTIGDFRAAMVGAYDGLTSASYYGRSIHLMSDIMGEDVKQTGSANRYQEFSDFEGLPRSGHNYEQALWQMAYEVVNRLNNIINAEFEAPGGVAAEFQQIMGEAYALRGLVYFDLVKMYAQHYTFSGGAGHPGVPIVLEDDVTNLPTRNTVAEVYAQAISDLNQGINMMTQVRNGPYFMNRNSARAILSRIYLYMEDWSNAAAMADAVINSGDYALATGDAYVSMYVPGGSSEAIFELQFTPTDNRGSDCLGCMYTANGYGDYLPAKDLLDMLPEGDIRWGHYTTDANLVGIYASHRVHKWPTPQQHDNVPVIRLSELYLNRAEANARLGNAAAAQADLNMIRQRGFAGAAPVTATGQALIDEILMERRKELGYEGHSIHDLMRNQRSFVRDDCTGDVCSVSYPCQFCILPIPEWEMNANPNIAQNPGY